MYVDREVDRHPQIVWGKGTDFLGTVTMAAKKKQPSLPRNGMYVSPYCMQLIEY